MDKETEAAGGEGRPRVGEGGISSGLRRMLPTRSGRAAAEGRKAGDYAAAATPGPRNLPLAGTSGMSFPESSIFADVELFASKWKS